jgi:serine/threonine protein kinase/dipeptidyl aminopeptidase/acylaminoacyl peptidase
MGEVYRAHDVRLGRDVAIKVLPQHVTATPLARTRFEREARTISRFNHPHICAVYDVGREGEVEYLVMELIEGETLARKIGRGSLPIEQVLRHGIEISDALAHAHDQAIIHRDLKGSNVVVTGGGAAKVLDFGLAHSAGIPGGADEPRADSTITEPGTIVGTPHYLAPELLRGGRADARSDIWALGVLLYEMAAGGSPFAGRTEYELSAAILNAMPAPLPPHVPAGLRTVIERCLAKDAAQRYRSAGEVRAALEALRGSVDATTLHRPMKAGKWVLRLGVGVLALAVVVAGAWILVGHPWRLKELKQRQLTSNPPEDPVGWGAVSPDGKSLVVVDKSGLTLRSVDTGESHAIALPEGLSLTGSLWPVVSWFPDGGTLLVSGTSPDGTPCEWAIPVAGGRARRLFGDGNWATISPDGSRLAYVRRGAAGGEIWCTDANGGGARRVASSDSAGFITTWAVWAPGGRRLAYLRASVGPNGYTLRIENTDLDGRTRVAFASTAEQRLHPLAVPAWLPDGRMVFGLTDPPPNQRDMNLWSLNVDPRSGAPSGNPRRVTQWQRLSLVVPSGFSADGRRLSVGIVEYQSDCYVGRSAGGDSTLQGVSRLTFDTRFDVEPSWTHDGDAILFASDRNGSVDIFRQAIGEADAVPLVAGPGDQSEPQMSPDGAWVIYKDAPEAPRGGTTGTAAIERMPSAGGAPEKVFDTQPAASFRCGGLPGSPCVLCEMDHGNAVFTEFDPVRGRGREVARVKAEELLPWDLSRDGTAIAFTAPSDSIATIRIISTRGGVSKRVTLDRPIGVQNIAWAVDGQSWFVVSRTSEGDWRLTRVKVDGTTVSLIPRQQWMYDAAASPDGKHVAYTSNTVDGNIWLLEDF